MPISDYLLNAPLTGRTPSGAGVPILDVLRALGLFGKKVSTAEPNYAVTPDTANTMPAAQPDQPVVMQPAARANEPGPVAQSKPAGGAQPAKSAGKKEEPLSKILKRIEEYGGSITASQVFKDPGFNERKARQVADAMAEMRGQVAGRDSAMPVPVAPTEAQPPKGFFGKVGAGASRVLDTLAKPETRAAMGDVAQAFSHPVVNAQTGAVLKQPWQARLGGMVRNRANDQMFQEALAGGTPSRALPAELADKAIAARQRQTALGQEDKKLDLERRKVAQAEKEGGVMMDYHEALIKKVLKDVEMVPAPTVVTVTNGNKEQQMVWDQKTASWQPLGEGGLRDQVIAGQATVQAAGVRANATKTGMTIAELGTATNTITTELAPLFLPIAKQVAPDVMQDIRDPFGGINKTALIGSLPKWAADRFQLLVSEYTKMLSEGTEPGLAKNAIMQVAGDPAFLAQPIQSTEERDALPAGAYYHLGDALFMRGQGGIETDQPIDTGGDDAKAGR